VGAGSREENASKQKARASVPIQSERKKALAARLPARLHWLGVRRDPDANAASAKTIHAEASKVDVLVVPTSEETSIARHCQARLNMRVRSR
jgi:acetate kinase